MLTYYQLKILNSTMKNWKKVRIAHFPCQKKKTFKKSTEICLCSFKQTPKSTVQAQWGNIQAWYKKYCKLIYKLLNMYKRKKIMWLANNQNLRTLFWPVIHSSMCTCTSITYYDTLPFLGWKVQNCHNFIPKVFPNVKAC